MQKCRLRPILRSYKQTKLKMRQRENLLLSFHLTLNYLNKFRPTIFFLSKTFFTMHNYILHGQGNQFLRNCARVFFFLFNCGTKSCSRTRRLSSCLWPERNKEEKVIAGLRGVQARTRRIRGQKGRRIRRVDGRDWHTRVCNLHA